MSRSISPLLFQISVFAVSSFLIFVFVTIIYLVLQYKKKKKKFCNIFNSYPDEINKESVIRILEKLEENFFNSAGKFDAGEVEKERRKYLEACRLVEYFGYETSDGVENLEELEKGSVS